MTKAVDEGKYKRLQARTLELIEQGFDIKPAMLTAGYGKQYVVQTWRAFAEKYVNTDKLAPILKRKAGLLQSHVMDKAFEWADDKDPKNHAVAAKVAGDSGRLHLEDKTPSSITFNFQTVDKQLVVKQGKNVDKQQLSTDIEDVE